MKTSDVSNALRDLISLSYSITVDPDGYLVDARDCSTRIKIDTADQKGNKRELIIYKENLPTPVDYFIMNPFAEGNAGGSPPTNYFYAAMRSALFMRLVRCVATVVRFIQKQKGIEFDDPRYQIEGSPKCLLDAASGPAVKGKTFADLVDAKTYDNIMSYFNTKGAAKNFVFIGYDKKQLKSSMRIEIITNPNFGGDDEEIGKMRKVDIQVLRGIIESIFGIKKPADLEKYSYTSVDQSAPPKMDSWLNVLFMAYRAMNPILELVADAEDDAALEVDLSVFRTHLSNLGEYAGNAKWMLQTNMSPDDGGTDTNIPSARLDNRSRGQSTSVPLARPSDPRDYRDPRDEPRRHPADEHVRVTRSGVPIMSDPRGYDNRGHDRGGRGYDNRGYDRGGYDNRGYDNRGYDRGYDRGGYDRGGYGYDRGRQLRSDPYMPALQTRPMY